MPDSKWHHLLSIQILAADLPLWHEEYRFHPKRRWRFDIAWPELMIAMEIDGGVWTSGRHTRGQGYINDCEKCNEAALLGWKVLHFTPNMVEDGSVIAVLERAIKQASSDAPASTRIVSES